MNETLNATLNATINATQNETVKQAASSAANFTLDKFFNMEWAAGIALWLNTTLKTDLFSSAIVGVVFPLVSIALLYFKWGAVVNMLDHLGKFLILMVAGFLLLKAFGVL
jgi:hypothetical protein